MYNWWKNHDLCYEMETCMLQTWRWIVLSNDRSVNKSNNFCENSNTVFVGDVEDNLKPINYKFECNQREKCHNLWNQRWKRCMTKLMSYTWQFVNENCSQQITSIVQSQNTCETNMQEYKYGCAK